MNAHGTHWLPSSGSVPRGPATTWQEADPAGVLTQTGRCHVGAPAAARCMEASVKKRRAASVNDERPFPHDSEASTSGTPGCLTKAARIRSTGLPEASVTAVQKSSDVALPYACFSRYALI